MQGEAKKIPNTGDVKKYIERIMKLEEEMSDLKSDIKAIYSEAKFSGIDSKALKVVVKHKRKPIGVDLRQEVNIIMEKTGESPLFAFV